MVNIFFNENNRKKTIILLSIPLIIIIALILYSMGVFKLNTEITASKQRWGTAQIRDVKVAISSSGSIQPATNIEVSARIEGKIEKVYFESGDIVEKDEILYELDDFSEQLKIQTLANSLTKQKRLVQSNYNELSNMNISAPFSGIVSNIKVSSGKEIEKNSEILTLTDTNNLYTKVQLDERYIGKIDIDDECELEIGDNSEDNDNTVTTKGLISFVGTNTYISSDGKKVFDVEIEFSNTGTLLEKEKVKARFKIDGNEIESENNGTVMYINKKVIKTTSGGTITSFNLKENQLVTSGSLLITLENKNLELEVSDSKIKLQELQKEYEETIEKLADYKIKAEYGGTIVSQSIAEGDNVKPDTVMCSILDEGNYELSITIDELDISQIELSQKANITIEALIETEQEPLVGEVASIYDVGTSENGVTSYPVIIKMDKSENLKEGMNAHVEIIIEEKEGALVVPIEALSERGGKNYVYIEGEESGNQINENQEDNQNQRNNIRNRGSLLEYYQGTIQKEVEIGISNEEYVEIISGLNENDKVLLPQLSTETRDGESSERSNGMNNFGGMGNMDRMPNIGDQGPSGNFERSRDTSGSSSSGNGGNK